MIGAIIRRIFGTANERYIKTLNHYIEAINDLEPEIEKLSDEELKSRTDWFRKRLKDGETLDDILVDAFATVREAAKRTLGQRHFDVQLIGGIVLHKGMIAEMKTGEGKTLVATLAVYLNAISGKGAHVVTVNDYLASRDSEWMGQVYKFLGLTVGCIVHGLDDDERRDVYNRDVVYATNNELGFDYLRDNMKFRLDEMVQRPFNFAIVDEVDSILIDEARTPLIISGAAENSSERYISVNRLVQKLDETHYEKDEKQKVTTLTDAGVEKIEELLKNAGLLEGNSLYDIGNISLVHHVDQALRARVMFHLDVDYIVKDGRVVIIDEFTGRMMEGRRYSDGLHQAIEAKEDVPIQSENQTLASITFQNYFRLYPKLAGMTGTALTEAAEFMDIYSLEVIEIPTNLPVARDDMHDEIYRTAKEKNDAIVQLIREAVNRNQPVLVGTTSIEKSEQLGQLLTKEKNIKYNILNAKHHEQEAKIIAQAGVPKAVTIATNMAGRGTDIQLGGHLEMRISQELGSITDEKERKKAIEKIKAEIKEKKDIAKKGGGLFVIGTERHESRRIDNQLRGRSGRQGDPGASKFFLSLEDDLMRIFGTDRMDSMLQRLGLEEGEAIIHPWINKALAKAQQKVESWNFDIRKNLLKYDDVMNDQRKVIYEQRKDLMDADDISETIVSMRQEIISDLVAEYLPAKAIHEQWDAEGLKNECTRLLNIDLPIKEWIAEEGVDDIVIEERILQASNNMMAEKAVRFGPDVMRMVEKSMVLQILDQTWKEHLLGLDYLRHTVSLRAYGQKDPLNEYKKEAFTMFKFLLEQVRERTTNVLSMVQIEAEPAPEMFDREMPSNMQQVHEKPAQAIGSSDEKNQPFRHANQEDFDASDPSTWGKVARNAPCPCGSGKKYKHCHGRIS